jgi:hypothetical protein
MQLTEKELNYVLTESFRRILKEYDAVEDTNDKNDGAEGKGLESGTFTDPNYQKKFKNTFFGKNPTSIGAQIGKGALGLAKVGGAYIAIATLSNLMAQLGMPEGLATLLGCGVAAGICGNILTNLITKLKILNQVDKLPLPKIARNVPHYAEIAGKQKVETQNLCLEAKKDLLKAIAAYNKAASKSLDFEGAIAHAKANASKYSRGKGYNGTDEYDAISSNGNYHKQAIKNSELNADMSNANAGKTYTENKRRMRIVEAETDPSILDPEPIDPNDNENTANPEIEKAEEEMIFRVGQYLCYFSMWRKWIRYIHVLCKKFPNHVKWDDIINGNFKSGDKVDSIAKNIGKSMLKKWGIEGWGDTAKDLFDKGKETKDDKPKYNGADDRGINLQVIAVNYDFTLTSEDNGTGNVRYYKGTLLQDAFTGTKYVINNNSFAQDATYLYMPKTDDEVRKVYSYAEVSTPGARVRPLILLSNDVVDEKRITKIQ